MARLLELESGRLYLRQWRDSDLEAFALLNADSRVMQYFPATLDRAASDAFARRCTELIAERGWGLWALERKSDGAFIGFTGLHIPGAALPFSPCVEIGWRLAREFWQQGYASEAARVALCAGFTGLGLDEIVSFTAVNNLRSRAVMQRIGMQADAATFMHPALPTDSPLREHCLYRLQRQQWWQQNPAV